MTDPTATKALDVHDVVDVVNSPEVQEIEALLPVVVKETKVGYKTTEFWLAVVAAVVTSVGVVPTPHDAKGYIVAGIAVAYAIARGIAKLGQPDVQPVPVAVAPVDEIAQRSGAAEAV